MTTERDLRRRAAPIAVGATDAVDAGDASETTQLLAGGASEESAPPPASISRSQTWAADFEHLPAWRRPSVFWLLGPFLLFTLAFGGVMVPKLNLIVDLVCRSYFADQNHQDPNFTFAPVVLGGENPQCFIPEVQSKVATFTLGLSVLTGILSAVTAPKLGALSDRYGRTRFLAFASVGGVLNEIITILAAKFPDTIDFHWLILGALFDGVTGSFTAGGVLTNSYTSDCTPPSRRGVHIGYLHACLFSGLAFGPLLAGYFVKYTGSLLSIFYVTLGCHIVFICFIWLVTPESVSKKRQMMAREKHAIEQEATAARLRSQLPGSLAPSSGVFASIGHHVSESVPFLLSLNVFAPLKILVPTGRGKGLVRRNMIILALVDAVIISAAFGAGTVTILYVEATFEWGTFESSRFVSFLSFVRAGTLLAVFPAINYFFRIRPMERRRRETGVHEEETNAGSDEVDLWMLRLSLLSDVVGIVGYVFARRPEIFVLFGVATAFGGLGGAVIQSTLTKHVPAEKVGSLLGAIGLLHSLGRVFAPLLFNGIYAATVKSYPQAFFVVLSSIFGLALIGSIFVRPHLFHGGDDDDDDDEDYEPVPQSGPLFEPEESGIPAN